MMPTIRDREERELAATTFDRNVVVTAGAGTGKTTLLVDRLVHLLIRYPDPLKITEIVALTFTNKAADEMKLRLRERLQALLSARLNREVRTESEKQIQTDLQNLTARYHRTKDQIDVLARDALRNMERSAIGTIHRFAATLLRLYPIEAGLDPQFTEDDGSRFEQLFEQQWALWLDQELSRSGAHREQWKAFLREFSLEDLRQLAFCLAVETVPLDRLAEIARASEFPECVTGWLKQLENDGGELLRQHAGDARQIAALVQLAVKVIRHCARNGAPQEALPVDERELLTTKSASAVQGWSDAAVEQAKDLVRVARRLLAVDNDLVRRVCDHLIPFVRDCRRCLIAQGFVSFDGLLVRARDLVRDHAGVRGELKHQFKSMLIDEFQDTDPIQYEILLYLGEQLGQTARTWRRVKLEQGKLFIVGDPKQSIYAFRRADIEAYLHVVQKMITRQNGVEYQLKTNFRSHKGILDVVNGVFEKLIVPRAGLQPSYADIHPAEDDPIPAANTSFRKVALRQVDNREPASADAARRLEAENLARWLDEEVIGKAVILNRDREPAIVRAKDVAFLLRKLTDIHLYLEPLRRRGIPYVVEGERHFYATQEIIDAVNLLRAVANPYDRAALVGVLRSPVGALTDRDIYELHRENLLNYRQTAASLTPCVRDLYTALSGLHERTQELPVGEAVNLLFSRIPIQILAARSFNGEQAVANLEKVRQLAERLGREGAATLKEVIGRLHRSILDLKEEGESALAEESVDAVHILSVHKSKGLEFPLVVLIGCHSPVDSRDPRIGVHHEWATNLVGLNVADHWSLPGVYLAEKHRQRSIEEQKRVFYVAMTRAREHLTLSCGPGTKHSGGTFLGMLESALGESPAANGTGPVSIGKGQIETTIIAEKLAPPKKTIKRQIDAYPPIDWTSYARFWQQRKERFNALSRASLFINPTALKSREQARVERFAGKGDLVSPDHARLVGQLAHQFLENWEFAADWQGFKNKLLRFLEPFPDSAFNGARPAVLAELEEIFTTFFTSRVYAELASAGILGREVPFLVPWNGQVMEGIIDLIYERKGRLYLADYKTDSVAEHDMRHKAREYGNQARIYSQAARQCLDREISGFKLIFVRLGEALDVPLDQSAVQYSLPL